MHLDMQTSLIMLFEDFEVGSIKIGGGELFKWLKVKWLLLRWAGHSISQRSISFRENGLNRWAQAQRNYHNYTVEDWKIIAWTHESCEIPMVGTDFGVNNTKPFLFSWHILDLQEKQGIEKLNATLKARCI